MRRAGIEAREGDEGIGTPKSLVRGSIASDMNLCSYISFAKSNTPDNIVQPIDAVRKDRSEHRNFGRLIFRRALFRQLAFLFFHLSAGVTSVLAQTQAPPPIVGQLGKDVMWVATSPTLVERMLDMANVTEKDFLVDLGSGDGVVVIAAAKRGARALGIEYDAGLVELSKRLAAQAGVSDRATFLKANLFETDFSAATVVTMYLTESLNLRLRPRLLAMRPGTRIVSQPFLLGHWVPDDSVTITSFRSLLAPFIKTNDHCFFRCTAYLWIVPTSVDGTWKMRDGKLVLKQSYQFVEGTLNRNGKTLPVTNGKLTGDHITFNAGASTYTGRISADAMVGIATGDGASAQWKAFRTRN